MNQGGAEGDRTGRGYWNELWTEGSLPPPIDPQSRSWRHYIDRRFHAFYRDIFGETRGATLLEVGCGNSVMLPYFARAFGFSVAGIDYSEEGCTKARAILEREGVAGDVYLADLFSPPGELIGCADVVVSLGVVEHFTDTEACVRAVGRLARPGGMVVTVIPNMSGLPGGVQKRINRPVWDAHVSLSAESLRKAHERAGMEVSLSGYFIGMNFGVLNLFGTDPERISTRLKRLLLKLLNLATFVAWQIESMTGAKLPPSELLSPYVVTVGRRPGESGT